MDSASETDSRLRNGVALSALLCATFSAAIYVAFLLLWAYSHSFSGRQPLGAVAIWVGLLFAVYAFAAGLFARGIARVLIVVGSAAAAFLWLLAGVASAAV